MDMKIYESLNKTEVWVSLAIVCLLLNVDIELGWYLIGNFPKEIADGVNSVIKNLCYGIVSAAIFHFLVNYCVHKNYMLKMNPYVNRKFWEMREILRQSENLFSPTFEVKDNNYTKEEKIQNVKRKDLYEKFPFKSSGGKDVDYLDKLYEFRGQLSLVVDTLLSKRELLTDEQFDFVCEVSNSSFLTANYIVPNHKVCKEENKNQNAIGLSIITLCEKSRNL